MERAMYNNDLDTLNIIYNPISWIHPKHFSLPVGFSAPRCHRVINDILITNFSLSVEPLDFDNEKERYLARNWRFLSRAALMVACQRYKSNLFKYGIWWKLENSIRQFSLLHFLDNIDGGTFISSIEQYLLCARQEIDLFASSVSVTMKERIPLLFPAGDDNKSIPSLLVDDNDMIMRMAIQHAQRS